MKKLFLLTAAAAAMIALSAAVCPAANCPWNSAASVEADCKTFCAQKFTGEQKQLCQDTCATAKLKYQPWTTTPCGYVNTGKCSGDLNKGLNTATQPGQKAAWFATIKRGCLGDELSAKDTY